MSTPERSTAGASPASGHQRPDLEPLTITGASQARCLVRAFSRDGRLEVSRLVQLVGPTARYSARVVEADRSAVAEETVDRSVVERAVLLPGVAPPRLLPGEAETAEQSC